MSKYIIDGELRDSLVGLITLLQRDSERIYHKNTGKSSYRIITDDGKEIKLPFLKELELDLRNLEQVIAEETYNAKAEEILLIAKEMGLL